MRASYRTAAAVAAVLMTATMAPTVARADESGWRNPTCTTVSSDGTLSYTRTEGYKIASTEGIAHQTKYQTGLVTLAAPNQLLAVDHTGRLSLSRDAGCTWAVVGTLGRYTRWPQLTAAPDGSAYVWSLDGDLFVVRRGTQVEERPSVSGDAGLVDLAVDRTDANHVRAVADDGRVLDSTDGGRSFTQIGTAAIPQSELNSLYDATIDPADLDHIVAGASVLGAFVTTDGAHTWTHASGLGKDADRVNAFSTAISPASGSTVYVQGLNLTEGQANGTDNARHIYVSTDGGRHFRVALTQRGQVTLPNGTLLVPSPTDPSVLYFVWGTSYAGIGTYLYRYDADSHLVNWSRNGYDDIKSIAFNPRYPSVMYLGLAEERIS